ncbi:DUF4192 family protein [Microbacterium sp. KR10-403]|uniref:DUF4192 family protein n=1 Tax=Microbacterium sp. KR10-403 TaxID=3158581 RepID=UPI0032E42C48
MDTAEQPTILRSASGADFLATVPALAGRTISHSIAVIPFTGTRTFGLMRIDLPPADVGEDAHDRIASVALGAMSRIDWCDGVMFVVYADDTFPAAFAGHEALVSRLDERFEDAGFAVKDAFCVAADGWASWYEEEPPFDGHDLDEIARSALGVEAARACGKTPPVPHDREGALPPTDPRTLAAVTAAVDDLLTDATERNGFGMRIPAALPDPVDFVEVLLRREADDTPLRVLAQFAALSVHRAHRDVMTLQIAFGRKTGRRARAENDRWLALQRERGQTMDDVVRAEFEAAGGPTASEMGELIIGERSTRPRPARIRRAIGILGRTIAHLPADLRPDLLSMLAWLHWALGSSTAAGAHIDAALAIDPNHGMALILRTLVASGKIPQWVFAHYNDAGARLHAATASRVPAASSV